MRMRFDARCASSKRWAFRLAGAACLIGLWAACPCLGWPAPPPEESKSGQQIPGELKGSLAKHVKDLEKKLADLWDRSHFAQALPLAQEVSELRNRVQGKDHWQAVTAAWEVKTLTKVASRPPKEQIEFAEAERAKTKGLGYYAQGKYAEAQPLLEKALAIRRDVLGEDHPRTAQSYNFVAADFDAQGKSAQAQPLIEKALAIDRKVLGETHPDTARSYNNVANNLSAQGKSALAQPLYEKALAIRRKVFGEEHPDTAGSYNNIANNLHDQGKYALAQPLYEKALALNRKVHGEDHPDTAGCYANAAVNLNGQGKYAEAQPLYEKALAIDRKVLGENHPDTAWCYNMMAANLTTQGKYAQAQPLYEKALAIYRGVLGENHPDTACCYTNVAINLSRQGKYAQAQPLYEQMLAINRKGLGEDHPETARSYTNLAFNLNAQGKYAQAQPLCEKALAINRKGLGENHPETARIYNNVAFNLNAQGKYAQAQPLYEKALAFFRRTLGEDHPSTAGCYNNVAFNLNAQGKYAEARAAWTKAASGFAVARIRASSRGLDRSLLSFGEPQKALSCCLGRAGEPATAWRWLESGLARGLLDETSAEVSRPRSPAERQHENEIAGRLDSLDGQVLALVSSNNKLNTTELEALTRQRRELEEDLGRFEAERSGREVYELDRVQASLGPDFALVVWVDQAGRLQAADPNGEHWACVLRSKGAPIWVRLPGTGEHGKWMENDNSLCDRVRAALVADQTSAREDLAAMLSALYRQRLAPLAGALGSRGDLPAVRHLVVSSAWWMAGIPVEATSSDFVISYSPSATSFAKAVERRQVAKDKDRPVDAFSFLGLGDPAFAGDKAQRLAGTRQEIDAVAALFEQPRTLVGSDACRERLDAMATAGELRRYRYLHFATHGIMDAAIAMNSALLLSQGHVVPGAEQVRAGTPADTGRLTAGEVLEHWKLDADLVVLSACQTGLGRPAGGEGYLGFSQAFFLAGARSLVLSLWKVDDRATALLMTRFYQNLLGKRSGLSRPMPKAESLKEAKEWLRQLTSKEINDVPSSLSRGEVSAERPTPATQGEHPYADPYFWAAFILIGDPE
jgi:CHAT domain-containing protein/tetratricopeptide (TPR) repeat protein